MSENNISENNIEEVNDNLVTLVDEEGKTHSFELLDAIETDDGKFIALLPFSEEESDEEIEEMTELLCSKGIIPTFRSLRTGPLNSEPLRNAIGDQPPADADRMIKLAKMQKEKLMKYQLDTRSCRTMCLECGCCDLVPFRDL